jgi:hypothetical protein
MIDYHLLQLLQHYQNEMMELHLHYALVYDLYEMTIQN